MAAVKTTKAAAPVTRADRPFATRPALASGIVDAAHVTRSPGAVGLALQIAARAALERESAALRGGGHWREGVREDMVVPLGDSHRSGRRV